MILYVETNFVLELAFQQEEYENCRAILDLARERRGALNLALPAFCIGEAYSRQIRRQRDRKELQRRLVAELGEFSSSPAYAGRLQEIREVTALLVESGEEERRNLESVLNELYESATLIPLDQTVAREAHRQQARRGLGPQDALIYASVLAHLERADTASSPPERQDCFVTRDEDFADDDVRADLEALGCKLLFKFDGALRYVRSRLE